MAGLRVASFFAGIGGFDIGFEQAGFSISYQCEIHDFCNSVLKYHWPKTLRANDILTIHSNDIPKSEIWCGGFPCQDLSVARGSSGRHGLKGDRSKLFFRLSELAKIKKPHVILLENVCGLLSSNNGKDFAELLYTLNELNYAVSWRLLNSRYFGIPQSRPRIYICAWRNNPIAAGNVLFESFLPAPTNHERSAFLSTSWKEGSLGPIPPKLAFCLAATSGRHTGTDWSRTYIPYEKEVRRLTPLECERLQGFPDHWTKLHLEGIDVEKSDSLRYHALGNAVSVPVIKWIAERIHQQFDVNGVVPKKNKKFELSVNHLKKWPALYNSKAIIGNLSKVREEKTKSKWAKAGISWKNRFIANNISPSPCNPIYADLIDIVEYDRPDSRYFLSPNAAEGILRRVDSQNRRLFPHLRRALEELSGRSSHRRENLDIFLQIELPLLEEMECV